MILKSRTLGSSVTSSGKFPTRFTALRISFLTVTTSLTFDSRVIIILERPSREVEVMFFIPLTFNSSLSITLVTLCSTSSGEAPG